MKKLWKEGTLLTGINYWASDNAVRMWEDFHPEVIDEDFRKLASVGVTMLRVFPLWPVFQPLTAAYSNNGIHEIQWNEKPLPDTPAGRAGVSEQACERFQIFCDLAQKHSLKLMVGLITGHMSFRYFAPAPFQHRNPVTDPTLIKWELRFVKYFVGRFKDHPAIAAWDLGNELDGFESRPESATPDAGYLWMTAIANAARLADPVHPIISGFGGGDKIEGLFPCEEIGEALDLNTVHPYHVFRPKDGPIHTMRPILDGICRCQVSNGLSGIPTFIQEVGSIGYLLCSERTEADFYRALLYAAWSHGCGGVMWWCAFDQGMQDYAPYDWNNIGSDYGFFRADGSEKPVARENVAFRQFISSLPFESLPPHINDGVCIIPRSSKKGEIRNMLNATFCLAKQANLDLTFVHFDQSVPQSHLYLIPSVDHNHGISRHCLMDILQRVKAGATLYISVGKANFRMIKELTGAAFSYREQGGAETVRLGDTALPLTADFRYGTEHTDGAEVLARGEDGRAVYLRHAYGKGYVYFSTVPVEKALAERKTAFRAQEPEYAAWYRVFAERLPSQKVLDTDSAVIRATEHVADEHTRYAVLINYAEKPQSATVTLQAGWRVAKIYGGELQDGTLELNCCAAVLLELKKA
ncbi:MAG: hypothetical protein E7585_03845 [Ruminococcaceae bacterium]|nr:hypothetical protein [Oscillospiraceae bacterium]